MGPGGLTNNDFPHGVEDIDTEKLEKLEEKLDVKIKVSAAKKKQSKKKEEENNLAFLYKIFCIYINES